MRLGETEIGDPETVKSHKESQSLLTNLLLQFVKTEVLNQNSFNVILAGDKVEASRLGKELLESRSIKTMVDDTIRSDELQELAKDNGALSWWSWFIRKGALVHKVTEGRWADKKVCMEKYWLHIINVSRNYQLVKELKFP